MGKNTNNKSKFKMFYVPNTRKHNQEYLWHSKLCYASSDEPTLYFCCFLIEETIKYLPYINLQDQLTVNRLRITETLLRQNKVCILKRSHKIIQFVAVTFLRLPFLPSSCTKYYFAANGMRVTKIHCMFTK